MLALLSFALAAPQSPVAPRPKLLESLVRIEQWQEDFWIEVGSGTLVKGYWTDSPYEVVTAAHVLDNINPMVVSESMHKLCDIDNYCIEVGPAAVHRLSIKDVAAISVPLPVGAPAKFGRELGFGDSVVIQGYPRKELTYVTGQVIGSSEEHLRVLSWCDYGSSGGGVFHKGKLSAVVISINSQVVFGTFAIDRPGVCYVQSLF